jgi:hypothetical protein
MQVSTELLEIDRINLKRAYGGSLSTVNEDISFEEKASIVFYRHGFSGLKN